ncbi:MAG: DNA-binding protein [Chitinophagaceae bacterium]|nr:MAG: DNA-binding protein [Chitinophagaceae bacterium]
MKTHAIRLKPGADLRKELQAFADREGIEASWIVTCAGSLTDYHIRFANQQEGARKSGHFEIVSLGGTLSKNGSHIHISVADSSGQCTGGHLLEGNRIYTTAEIVIQEDPSLVFTREKDGTTPWEELQVKKK